MTCPCTDEDFPSPDFPVLPRNRDSEPPASTHFSKGRGHPSGEDAPRLRVSYREEMRSRFVSLERQIKDDQVRARQFEQSCQRVQKLKDELAGGPACLLISVFEVELSICVAGRETKCYDSGSSEGVRKRG